MHVCDFSLIWGANVGDGFQVHVFDDAELEMVPESSGCMCFKHNKKRSFWRDLTFPTKSLLIWCPRGRVLVLILVSFGKLGGTCSYF